MNVKEEVDKAIKDNLFGEDDRKLGTFMFSLFNQGPKAMSKKKDKDYANWFKNLRKNGIISKDFKIVVDEEFEENSGIEFALMMCCAKGFIKRV